MNRRDDRPIRPPVGVVTRWFAGYFGRLARRHFAGVHWDAAEDPAGWDATPILFVANHSTWWDGPLALLLTARLGRTFHVAMEAAHLARHPYFGWIGAHPLRRDGASARYADLERIGGALTPGAALWLFPQGVRRSAAEAPTRLERGAAHLALTRAPVRVVPVGIRLAHLGEQVPDAFVRLGLSERILPGDPRDRRQLTDQLGGRLRATLGVMDSRIREERLQPWQPLLQGRLSVNKRLERLGRAFGLAERPFEPRNG